MAWTVATILVVQTLVVAVSMLPVAVAWAYLTSLDVSPLLRALIFAVAIGPSYALFALTLLPVSAIVTRAVGWRTPRDTEMRIADMEWPLLDWARYMAAIHLVRLLAGLVLRGTPVWTAYLRLSGARIGRRVYVNTLGLSDYNLLDFGDDVVVGADVHLAGHTVEGGLVKTGAVHLGNGVTVGVGSVVEIGVIAGDSCQIGALSFVPKHTTLAPGGVYVGIPVRRLDQSV
jgi:acetyltransferase-like isoleucine patch superfamily enzyme